jgi:hypothetical protein
VTRLHARCLAVLLLFFLALGGSDSPAMRPLGDTEAAVVAMRSLTAEIAKETRSPFIACVGFRDQLGTRDFPGELIDHLIFENPGFRPVSTCKLDAYYGSYSVPDRPRPVPLVFCGPGLFWGGGSLSSGNVTVRCGVHHGPLNGWGLVYEIGRSPIGTVEVTRLDGKWVE